MQIDIEYATLKLKVVELIIKERPPKTLEEVLADAQKIMIFLKKK
jgi:hypothetical protein